MFEETLLLGGWSGVDASDRRCPLYL